MEAILSLINSRIEDISDNLVENDKQLLFLENFFNSNYFNTVEKILKVDRLKLIVALIITGNNNLDVDTVYKVMDANKGLLEMSIEDLNKTVKVLELLLASSLSAYDQLRDYFKNNKMNIFRNFKYRFPFLKQNSDYCICQSDFALFMDLFRHNRVSIVDALCYNIVLKSISEEIERYSCNLDNLNKALGRHISDKKKFDTISKFIEKKWNYELIVKSVTDVKHYYELKQKKKNANDKEKNRLLESYRQLKSIISRAFENGEEIIYSDNIFGTINDSEFIKLVLQEIFLYNKAIYDKTNAEYLSLIAKSTLNYQTLLAKYNIDLDSNDLSAVMANSLSELEEMINMLRKVGIISSEYLSVIIQISDLETIKWYVSLIEDGKISCELLLNHVDLFNKKTKVFENFTNNLRMIKERKMNPYLFQSSQESLIIESSIFRSCIDTLISYSLLGQMKVGLNYSFLSNTDLASSIDTLLELGFEQYLEGDLELLNYSNKFNRLKLLKSLNMPISSKEELFDVLTSDKFFIPDEKIDDYIYNSVSYILPIDVFIEEKTGEFVNLVQGKDFCESLRTYNIDGVIFSKNKTLRNLSMVSADLSENEKVFYSLINGAVLTDDELDIVKKRVITNVSSDKKLVVS